MFFLETIYKNDNDKIRETIQSFHNAIRQLFDYCKILMKMMLLVPPQHKAQGLPPLVCQVKVMELFTCLKKEKNKHLHQHQVA
jgi:hypothetical protein